jgi:hypothetical protein
LAVIIIIGMTLAARARGEESSLLFLLSACCCEKCWPLSFYVCALTMGDIVK